MKNYYKILQIDKDASAEIIKVAYKLLVKKYHPDLKDGKEKKEAEEKIKEINEAYDVLSNSIKKAEYDQTLVNEYISQEQYNNLMSENTILKKELNYFKEIYNRPNTRTYSNTSYRNINDTSEDTSNTKNTTTSNNKYFNAIKNAFSNFDETLKTIIALTITLILTFIFLAIPFLRNFITIILSDGYILIIILIIVFYIYFFRNKK